jgi:hypothetical protein
VLKENNPIRITVIANDERSRTHPRHRRPSTALKTEIAGVIMPSP